MKKVIASTPTRIFRTLPLAALLASFGLARLAQAALGPLDAFAAAHLPVLCPLRRITGLPCPTCGLGRSLLSAWSGELSHSLAHHPLGPILLVATLLFCTAFAARPKRATGTLRSLSTGLASRPMLALARLGAYALWGFAR